MCVIAISPTGVNAPTESNLRDMFQYNDDGAGISYVLNNAVYTFKGMMTWADFEKTYALIEKKIKTAGKTLTDIPLVYHFRIGTHGPNSEALTHPFPISNQFKHLTALEYKADVVMAHNGIINSVTPRTGWSDTQQYISDIIMPLIKTDRYFYKNKHFQELMRNTNNGSRFVFLDKDGNYTTVGEWVSSDDPTLKGIIYSNLNHEFTYAYGKYVPTATYPSAFGSNQYSLRNTAFCVPVPVGGVLYTDLQLDTKLNPLPNMKGFVIKETHENDYWVDEYGDLYRMDSLTGFIYPMYSFDYAFFEDDILFSTRQDLKDKGEILYFGSGAIS